MRKTAIVVAGAAAAMLAMATNASALSTDIAAATLDTATNNSVAISVYATGSAPGVTCQPPTPAATQATPYTQVAIDAVLQTDVAEGNVECASFETGFKATLKLSFEYWVPNSSLPAGGSWHAIVPNASFGEACAPVSQTTPSSNDLAVVGPIEAQCVLNITNPATGKVRHARYDVSVQVGTITYKYPAVYSTAWS
ncbi:MAG: hypothetical protein QOC82_1143 [Frankiaceae bacterium]|jgi:hypothetical protein|nr:hypothetical protein [Frankiaceae bacterium]